MLPVQQLCQECFDINYCCLIGEITISLQTNASRPHLKIIIHKPYSMDWFKTSLTVVCTKVFNQKLSHYNNRYSKYHVNLPSEDFTKTKSLFRRVSSPHLYNTSAMVFHGLGCCFIYSSNSISWGILSIL